MTDTEKLEWACSVLSREKWDDRISWAAWQTSSGEMQVGTAGHGVDLSAFAAIAIALALDEQARRRLPEWKQAEWAAAELSRRNHAGCVAWKRVGTCVDSTDLGGYHASTAVCALSAADAVAIAESLIRREMLGDTSDANSKGVKP